MAIFCLQPKEPPVSELNVLLNLETTHERLDHARQVLHASTTFPRHREAFPDNSLEMAAFMASRIARDERRYEPEINALKITLIALGLKQHELVEALRNMDLKDVLVEIIQHPDGRLETMTFEEKMGKRKPV